MLNAKCMKIYLKKSYVKIMSLCCIREPPPVAVRASLKAAEACHQTRHSSSHRNVMKSFCTFVDSPETL